jgi:hypothetical protein
MTSYYIRNEDETVQGPYAREDVKAWIADGRLGDRVEYSTDTKTWRYARDLPELGGGVAPQPGAFPEPSLLIRQGANIQGPYAMSRIRRYVKQRRIQHYMLFSEDGVFWLGPEHVPGLLPEGYVPLPPPKRPTEVPADGEAPSDAEVRMPKQAKPPAPGEDVGSDTLVGLHMDEEEARALPPPPPTPPPAPPLPQSALPEEVVAAPVPVTYFVRTRGQDVYGPCTEDVLRTWIEEGRVDVSAEFSNDGQTWTPGRSMVSLFPGAAPREIPVQPAQAPRRRFRRR